MSEDDPYAQLVAAQFGAAVRAQETALASHASIDDERHVNIGIQITDLKEQGKDHETRLRTVEQATTQFKFLVSLSVGGGAMGVIVLLKELIK